MNTKLNALKKACLTSNVAIDLVHAAENDFDDAWDDYMAALASDNNVHASDRAVKAAHAALAAAHAAALAAHAALAALAALAGESAAE